MKKTALVLAIVLLLGMVALVSCGNACDGTYVYDSFDWNVGDDSTVSDIMKSTVESTIKAGYSQLEFELKGGKVYYGTVGGTLAEYGEYTIDGDEVTFAGQTYTYEGGKLTLAYESMGVSVKIIFKKK